MRLNQKVAREVGRVGRWVLASGAVAEAGVGVGVCIQGPTQELSGAWPRSVLAFPPGSLPEIGGRG